MFKQDTKLKKSSYICWQKHMLLISLLSGYSINFTADANAQENICAAIFSDIKSNLEINAISPLLQKDPFQKKRAEAQQFVSSLEETPAKRLLELDIRAVQKKRNVISPPMEELILSLCHENDRDHQRTSFPFAVEIKKVPQKDTHIDIIEETPKWLLDLFIAPEVVFAPIHPYTEIGKKLDPSQRIPFENFGTDREWEGRFTGSRSILFKHEGRYFSVKLATSVTNPFDLVLGPEQSKADLRKSVIISMNRSRLVSMVDKKIGKDPRLIVLKEVLAISSSGDGNGFTVRDFTPLMDGHYYKPSYSPQINAKQKAYIQGVMQALLFIRYGLVHKYPHEQNSMIQLTRSGGNLEPTGTAVTYDLSDTMIDASIGPIIAPEFFEIDSKAKYSTNTIRPYPDSMYVTQKKELEVGYWQTLESELGISQNEIRDPMQLQVAIRKYHHKKENNFHQ